jgi:hypothetical protein
MKTVDFKSLSLDNLKGEVWVDVIGFDGIYSASNYGRIKSEQRIVNNRSSKGRLIKEKILSPCTCNNRYQVNLTINNKSKTFDVSWLIFYSFYPEKHNNDKSKCVMHKNKIVSDNRLTNLELVSVSTSHKTNFIKGLLPHIHTLPRPTNKWRLRYGIYENGFLIKNTCNKCFIEKSINEFEPNRDTCKVCRSYNKGSKNPGVRLQITELKKSGLKKCPKCNNILKNDLFYNGSSYCKICTKEKNKQSIKRIINVK